MADVQSPSTDGVNKLRAAMQQVDAIMNLESFERSAGMRALDEALLAGQASLQEVSTFIKLQAKMVGRNPSCKR